MAEFFDKVLSGINKGVNTVSENSKIMVEKANLNTAKRNAENSRNVLYRQLGALVYNLRADGKIDAPEIEGLYNAITESTKNIEELEEKIRALDSNRQGASAPNAPIQNGVACGSCGHVNEAGSNFCAECGTRIG